MGLDICTKFRLKHACFLTDNETESKLRFYC